MTYIGVTANFNLRKRVHESSLKNGCHFNKNLQQDFNNGDDFAFTIIKRMQNKRDAMEYESNSIRYVSDSTYNVKVPNFKKVVFNSIDDIRALKTICHDGTYAIIIRNGKAQGNGVANLRVD